MKSRPILFSAPMVRALLAGTKTQTRRVEHHQPDAIGNWPRGTPPGTRDLDCDHGAPGDRLWAKETYRTERRFDYLKPKLVPQGSRLWFDADGPAPAWAGKARPSIFMCQWMPRITLELTSVRVERLQDISEEDAKAEGCSQRIEAPPPGMLGIRRPLLVWARGAYRELWESLNGPGSWDLNPWVWVLEFKRVPQVAP